MTKLAIAGVGLLVALGTPSLGDEPRTGGSPRGKSPGARRGPPPASAPTAPIPYPPIVLNGRAELECNISSRADGRQKLVMREGAGIAFDAAVSPIVDGVVETKGPTKGGVYSFTSHLVKPVPAKLAGVGDVTLTQLETRVTVGLSGYTQVAPGKPLSFEASQLLRGGSYLEFTGRAQGKSTGPAPTVYTFRVSFGEATFAEGRVEPESDNDRAPIASKMVVIHAPIVTSVLAQSTTTLQQQP